MYFISPINKEELFNLRHAQARNVIERIFGVLKRRFRILLIGPEYDVKVQAQIPAALCAIHNFIRIHNPQEEAILGEEEQVNQHVDAGDDNVQQTGFVEANDATNPVVKRRDTIAQEMWNDYQQILRERL
jgi:hypothetical protein